MTRAAWGVAHVAVPLAVLGVVLWQTGQGPFVAGVRALDLTTLALGAAIAVPATVAGAWRWHTVARALGTPVALAPAVASSYASQFLNSTLPAGVAGDLYRGLRHAGGAGRFVSLRAVAWERGAGQAVQAGLALAVLVLLPHSVRLPVPSLLAAGIVAVLVVGWAARQTVVRRDLRRLAAPGVVRAVVGSSLVAQTAYGATLVLAARAVGVTAPVATLLPLVVVVLVAMAVPFNIAGWGPREGAAAWCFAAAGLGAGPGVATAVAYGVMVTVASLPGAVVLAVSARRSGQEVSRDVAHV